MKQLASAKTVDAFIETVEVYDAFMRNVWSPLRAAALVGNEKVVNLLLEEGVSLDESDPTDKRTALHWAADEGHVEIVRALLDKGADPNVKSSLFGVTPIMDATAAGNIEVVKLLLIETHRLKSRRFLVHRAAPWQSLRRL